MFGDSYDDVDSWDSQPIGGLSSDSDERETKKRIAQEIADGVTMGTFERDEEVWAMVREIKSDRGEA